MNLELKVIIKSNQSIFYSLFVYQFEAYFILLKEFELDYLSIKYFFI